VSLRDRLTATARVALIVTAILALGVTSLSTISYLSVRERLRVDLDRALLRETEAFAASIDQTATAATGLDLHAAARAYLETRSSAYSDSHPLLLIKFPGGKVLSNSDIRLEDAPANAAALDTTIAARAFVDLEYKSAAYRAATVPVRGTRGANVAVFEAALPLGPSSELAAQLLRILAVASTLITALGALLSAIAARTSLAPLRHAAAAADRITQARLAERIGYQGPNDEVGRLVAAVNAMLDRLESAFREQRRFLADASHELRTPLAVVSGHLEILERTDLSAVEHAEELEIACDEVARMGRLVDDMLALARLEAEASRPFQLLEVATLLQEAAGRGRGLGPQRIVVDAPAGLWVYGEPDQLMQALLNLVNNAINNTPPTGTINLTATATREAVRLCVEDDGPGLKPDDLERVFDRFYRGSGPRGQGGGSGLGLAIVRRLVELHGGVAEAANLEGGGASLSITLPRAPAPED
jgi:two-component system OmpR family sensor kinase